ncbi:MAG: hypothetical protein KA715_01935 [Xanthomonadaceae bacterium]|nr:hypothetical protein [Xanthomonadaceae bacterium]
MHLSNLLILMIVSPLLGAVSQAFKPNRIFSFLASSIPTAILFFVFFQADWTTGKDLFFFRTEWIPHYQAELFLRINGINFLALLTVCLVSNVLLASFWKKKEYEPALSSMVLLTQAFSIISLLSGDLFVQAVFWGATAIPIYFLSALFGSKSGRSGFHFLIHSMLGVFLFFIGVLLVYYFSQPHSFDMAAIKAGLFQQSTDSFLGIAVPEWAFLFICFGVFLRLPLFPFTGWMTALTEELSVEMLVTHVGIFLTSTVVIFSQIIISVFGKQLTNFSLVFLVIGFLNAFIGVLLLVSGKSFPRIISAVGMLFFGIAIIALGSNNTFSVLSIVLSGLSVGMSVAGLAWIYSCLEAREYLWDRTGWKSTGLFFSLQSIIFSNIAFVPATSGFIPLALVLSGVFKKDPVVATICVIIGMLLAYAVFRIHDEKISGSSGEKIKLDAREKSIGILIVFLIVLLGVWPKELIKVSQPAVVELLKVVQQP